MNDKLSLLQQTAITYYGENMVDIIDNITTIRFPEFNIVHLGSGVTHLIKELYITLQETEPNKIKNIGGFRGMLSDKEWHSKYLHSHLGRFNNDPTKVSNKFCLGSSDLSVLCNTSNRGDFDEDEWMLFMLTLENYVQCESNGPFITFRTIGPSAGSNYASSRDLQNSILKFTETNEFHLPVELTGNYLKPVNVIVPDDFLRALVPYLNEEYRGTFDESLGYGVKGGDKKLFTGDTQFTFTFKGQVKRVTVYPTVIVTDKNDLDFPLQYVEKEIVKILNDRVNEKYGQYNSAARAYTGCSRSENYISNLFPA